MRKHAGKIFVFVANILLMAVAVLAIRVKDQNRLLKQSAGDGENTDNNSGNVINPPESFEGQIQRSTVEDSVPSDTEPQPVGQKSGTNPSKPPADTTTPQAAKNPAQNNNTSGSTQSPASSSGSSSKNAVTGSGTASGNTSPQSQPSANRKTKTS